MPQQCVVLGPILVLLPTTLRCGTSRSWLTTHLDCVICNPNNKLQQSCKKINNLCNWKQNIDTGLTRHNFIHFEIVTFKSLELVKKISSVTRLMLLTLFLLFINSLSRITPLLALTLKLRIHDLILFFAAENYSTLLYSTELP